MNTTNDRGSFAPHAPCNCEQCALKHGDQADLEQVEINALRNEVVKLKAERNRAEQHQETATEAAHELLGRAEKAETDVVRLKGELRLWSERHQCDSCRIGELAGAIAEGVAAKRERDALQLQLNTPGIDDFLDGVRREAAHQRERWKNTDPNKSDADWFWTVGYLVGKALHKEEKRLHHLITTAAALFNWHHYTKARGQR